MAQLSITAKSGFNTYSQPIYPSYPSETVWYSGKYEVFKDGQYIGSHNFPPADITFSVNNLRLDRTEDSAPQNGSDRFRSYKYECVISYPDEWLNVSIRLYFNQTWPNNNNPQPATKQSVAGSVSPKIFLSRDLLPKYGTAYTNKIWPTTGTTDGHTVNYPQSQPFRAYNLGTQTYDDVIETPRWAEGQQNKSMVDAVLTHLIWDWGDGTIDTIPLTNTEKVTGTTYVSNPDGTGQYIPSEWVTVGTITAPVSHTFTPDENGDGTGNPISIIAVDSVGRKSAKVNSVIGPHIEIQKSFDETTNSLILDTSKSYGRTGKITTEVYEGPNESYLTKLKGLVTKNEDGTETTNPLKFPVPLFKQGVYNFYSITRDKPYDIVYGYSASEYTTNTSVSGGDGKERYSRTKITVHNPYMSVVQYPDGAIIRAYATKGVNYVLEQGANPDDSNSYNTLTSAVLSPTYKAITKTLDDVSFPRLWREGMTTYLAGRYKDGKWKIWMAYNREVLDFQELSIMWTADYYHATVLPMIGGGTLSLAIKRVESNPIQNPKRYSVELWSRFTFDLDEWTTEPTKVYTILTNILADDTVNFYPLVLSEESANGSPRLVAGIANLDYESYDLGNTWTKIVL